MTKALIAIAVAALLLFSGLKYAAVRHRLLDQRTAIDKQWTGVESAMQRRADLISSRAAGLKGLSGETAEVTAKIAQARASLAASRTPREKMAAYSDLDQAIAHLLAMVQKERKSRGARLSHLPDDISNTENEVNVARQKYNEALETYNTMLQIFPNNVVAAVSGFTRNDAYIQTGTGAVRGAKVQF